MKKRVTITTIILSAVVIISCSEDKKSITKPTIPTVTQATVTYLGSAGYMLQSGSTKIMIDAPYDDFVAQYQVPVCTNTTAQQMAAGEELFSNVDLFLITHEHRGHFDYDLLGQCFAKNTNAQLITTQGVVNILQRNVQDFDTFQDRIMVPQLPYDTFIDTTINNISFRINKSHHWGPVELINFAFNLKGIEIGFVLEQGEYVQKNRFDLLFCGGLTSELNNRYIMLCHQSGTATIENLRNQSLSMDKASFLTVPLESATILKANSGVQVTLNQ